VLRNLTPLTQADRASPLWHRLRAELRLELDALREDLEKKQPEEATASIRTRLVAAR